METVLLIALASFFCWVTLRFLAPVRVPDRIALVLYGASAYGMTYLPRNILEALSGAGGLVLLTVLSRIEPPEGWASNIDWGYLELLRPRFPRKRTRTHPQDRPGPGRRIPQL